MFPAFLTTQIDHSNPADFSPPKAMGGTKKGFKTSLIFISSVTGVRVKLMLWKKR